MLTSDNMTVTQDFIYLANALVIQGYKSTSYYVSDLTRQSTFYIVLLNNGNVVAQLPVSGFRYTEVNFSLETLDYTATDSSSNSYTFDEIQLWGGNQYIITDDKLQQSITKNANLPLCITISLKLCVTANNYNNTVNVTITPSPNVSPITQTVPVITIWKYLSNGCSANFFNISIINFVILLLLIPTSFYGQISNTQFYSVYNILNTQLHQVDGLAIAGIIPVQQNYNVSSTRCTTVDVGIPFKPSTWMTNVYVGVFMITGGIATVAITVNTTMTTTEYYEVLVTT